MDLEARRASLLSSIARPAEGAIGLCVLDQGRMFFVRIVGGDSGARRADRDIERAAGDDRFTGRSMSEGVGVDVKRRCKLRAEEGKQAAFGNEPKSLR